MRKKITLLINSLWVFAILQAQPAVNAFYFASEMVIDSKGNLFVSGKNNKIIKITPDGHAYHFAGHPKSYTQCKDGKGADAMFLSDFERFFLGKEVSKAVLHLK